MNVRTGDLVANMRPTQMQILLLLFLALLRRFGLLPPEKNDDDFTRLGIGPGFDEAVRVSVAYVQNQQWPQEVKQTWIYKISVWKVEFQSGDVPVVVS